MVPARFILVAPFAYGLSLASAGTKKTSQVRETPHVPMVQAFDEIQGRVGVVSPFMNGQRHKYERTVEACTQRTRELIKEIEVEENEKLMATQHLKTNIVAARHQNTLLRRRLGRVHDDVERLRKSMMKLKANLTVAEEFGQRAAKVSKYAMADAKLKVITDLASGELAAKEAEEHKRRLEEIFNWPKTIEGLDDIDDDDADEMQDESDADESDADTTDTKHSHTKDESVADKGQNHAGTKHGSEHGTHGGSKHGTNEDTKEATKEDTHGGSKDVTKSGDDSEDVAPEDSIDLKGPVAVLLDTTKPKHHKHEEAFKKSVDALSKLRARMRGAVRSSETSMRSIDDQLRKVVSAKQDHMHELEKNYAKLETVYDDVMHKRTILKNALDFLHREQQELKDAKLSLANYMRSSAVQGLGVHKK